MYLLDTNFQLVQFSSLTLSEPSQFSAGEKEKKKKESYF